MVVRRRKNRPHQTCYYEGNNVLIHPGPSPIERDTMSDDRSPKIVQRVPAAPRWEAVFHPLDSPKGDFGTPVGAWALIEKGDPPIQRVVGVVAAGAEFLKPISEFDDTIEFVRYEVRNAESSEYRLTEAGRPR